MVVYSIRSMGRIFPKKLRVHCEEIGIVHTMLVGRDVDNAVAAYFVFVLVRAMVAVVVGIVVH